MTNTAPLRTAPDFANELWLALPKGGRTLGGSDETFLAAAGFQTVDKIERVDDYRLVDGPEFADVGVRAIEMKPQMALALLSTGQLNAAVVGRDVLKEFNNSRRGKKGVQAVEIVDLDMTPCALTIAVPEGDAAQISADMQGRVIVTKYPRLVENWAKANGVQFGEIVSQITDDADISGGIEGYRLFDPRVNAIADMVESGESLVRYGWKPLGISDADWAPVRADVLNNVPKGQRCKFTDMPMDTMRALPGTVMASSAVLVRSSARLTPAKEAAFKTLAGRFFDAARALGRTPTMKQTRVDKQFGKRPKPPAATTPEGARSGEIGHSAAFRHVIG